jgi:hypothetical protein
LKTLVQATGSPNWYPWRLETNGKKAGFQETALLLGRGLVERYEPLRGTRHDMVLYVLEAPLISLCCNLSEA